VPTKKSAARRGRPPEDDTPFAPKALYTVEQAAAGLLVSQRTLRRWMANGTVPTVRLKSSRAVRLRGSALNDLVTEDSDE
jgi:excisionase family DNA binding protein